MHRIRSTGLRLGVVFFAVCMSLSATKACAAAAWQDVRPVVATRAIATDGSHYVAAAGNGIWTSSDLKTWQRASLPAGVGVTYNDVIWDGSRFIAVGDGVINSADGSSWAVAYAPDVTAHFWSAIAVNAGTYVVVGSDGTKVLRSTNGTTWSLVATGVFVDPNASIVLQGIGSNGSLFVTSGYETSNSVGVFTGTQGDVVLTSPDGQTWTQQSLPNHGGALYNTGFTNNVASNGTTFVTGGGDGLYASLDGITWTANDLSTVLPVSSSAWIFGSIRFVNGQFIAAGADIPTGAVNQIAVFTSSDGANWTKHDLAAQQSSYYGMSSVIFTAGQYVAAGSQAVYSSNDASTWSLKSSGNQTNLPGCVIQGGGKYVLPGEGGTLVSSDGVTWPATPRVAFGRLFTLPGSGCGAYGNGTYVTIYSGGSALYWSTDAANWTAGFSSSGGPAFSGVAWSGSGFLAVGVTGGAPGIATSADGKTWTSSTPSGLPAGVASIGPYGGLIYANGQFVTWGSTSSTAFIATSPDGHAWSPATITGLPAGASVMSVAFGSGTYLALVNKTDGTSLVFSSTDGLNWSDVTGNIPKETWTTLIWGNNEFLAVGVDPTTGQGVAAEGNAAGSSWQSTLLQDSPQVNDVLWDGSKYVAVSDYDVLTLSSSGGSTGGGGGGGGGSGGSSSGGGGGAFDILALSLLSGLAIRRRERWMRG